ncbi:hypothetical protein QAD02_017573 [Eretmocerus hayati]|uniref:Uncharacterized protein n=1 Tax=Eretmocerus hayati TaxID=131215 RepID=A0ACC2PFH7_9HYME|nr:hypothetical protein QAD02_017573 [Eretmocerus hayati]
MEKMKSLECPFTWGFDDASLRTSVLRSFDGEETLPLMQLMRTILKRYAESKNSEKNSDTKSVGDEIMVWNVAECDELLSALENSDAEQNFSHDVIRHIVQATYAFIFSRAHMTAEREEILASINDVDMCDTIAKSTLLGCKGICFSIHDRAHPDEAKKLIQEAIDLNPKCHLWHFVLGRILRNERRDFYYGRIPTGEEVTAFNKAYSLSKNPVFGIFLAQVYRETKVNQEKSLEIYDRVFEEKPTSVMLLLRLALGFITFRKMERAAECLDKIPDPGEKNSMYLHYRGIYHFKLKNYDEAAKFFKDAAEDDNLGADYNYIECKLRMDENFKKEVSQYLLKMVEKYRRLPEKQIQRILLDVAISSWKNDGNIEEALRYFLRALDIDPKSKLFTYCNPFQIGVELKDKNIFRLVRREFLPHIHERYYCPEILAKAKKVEKYCADYENAQYESASNNFSSLRCRYSSKQFFMMMMERMESWEGPFKWGFEDVSIQKTPKLKPLDGHETLPLMQLMRMTMRRYADSITNESEIVDDQDMNFDETECDELLSALKNCDDEQEISHDVVRHVVYATYAFIFSKAHKGVELERVLSKIEDVNISDKKAKSTLLGCKGICWSVVHNLTDPHKAKHFLRTAIQENPKYHLWYFVVGRIGRAERRDLNHGIFKDAKEILSFETAYSLSQKPIYGLFLAQAYKERRIERERSLEIFEEIFQQQPEETAILLRLALGFLKYNKLERAKECLDNVSDPGTKASMFFHYKGLYYLKSEQYEEAAKFFERATIEDNLAADYNYIECKLKINENFKHEVSHCLLKMVEKYHHFPEKQTQRILLDVAISSWKNDSNIEQALKFFLQALEVDSESKIFTYWDPIQIGVEFRDKNIFRLLKRDFLPLVNGTSQEILGMKRALTRYCDAYLNAALARNRHNSFWRRH